MSPSTACGQHPRRYGFSSTGAASRSKTAHAAELDRPDIVWRRQAWFDGQPDLDLERLIFFDETAASTKIARLRGRAPYDERTAVSARDQGTIPTPNATSTARVW